MDIKDFSVGQTVWVKLTGNASRNKKGENLIEEWVVTSVGKKYIKASKKGLDYEVTFEPFDGRFVEKTDSCVDYEIYLSRKELEEEIEIAETGLQIRLFFGRHDWTKKITLDQVRTIRAIIEDIEKK